MTESSVHAALLAGVRVLDLTSGRGELTTRYFADLGAEVLRVAVPRDDLRENHQITLGSHRLHHMTHNANKYQARFDFSAGTTPTELEALIGVADLVVEDTIPGTLDRLGLAPTQLLDRHPQLVVVSLSDFGQTGPYRDWIGTEWTHLAMAAVLARSGLPHLPPLLPPGSLAIGCAAMQAAFAGLIAYLNRLDTGTGQHVDVSVYEATAQVLDPGYGIAGTASGATADRVETGRPDVQHYYPIFRCVDGYVRVFVMSARQWRGLRGWLGEPPELADPGLGRSLGNRLAAASRIYPVLAAFFADKCRDDLVADGQRHGVPITSLLSPSEVVGSDHFAGRGAFVDVQTPGGATIRVPNGFVEIDGVRAGLNRSAPDEDQHDGELVASWLAVAQERSNQPAPTTQAPIRETGRRPLAGLRVLDLGVMVVGAEMSRLLADQGAEVIKIETAAFCDGMRGTADDPITASFARGHRNKQSFGVDLRSAEGIKLFKGLVAGADVVLSNFKPGTLESLSLGYGALAEVNPQIVLIESSALGRSGPWSKQLGYGPLVRALTSLTGLWAVPGESGGFSDAATVYPDHAAPRVGAVAVLAALLRRRRTGIGAHITMSQAETILGHLADLFALESIHPGSMVATGNTGFGDAPRGLYRCAGDDDWCVIDIRGDDDWVRLAAAIDPQATEGLGRYASARTRLEHRTEIDDLVQRWTSGRTALQAMTVLQNAGVPAGMMTRVHELVDDPHLQARSFFDVLMQPQLKESLVVERAPAQFSSLPDPPQGPAPMLGEHTLQIARTLLGLSDGEIDHLVRSKVLEEARDRSVG